MICGHGVQGMIIASRGCSKWVTHIGSVDSHFAIRATATSRRHGVLIASLQNDRSWAKEESNEEKCTIAWQATIYSWDSIMPTVQSLDIYPQQRRETVSLQDHDLRIRGVRTTDFAGLRVRRQLIQRQTHHGLPRISARRERKKKRWKIKKKESSDRRT